jgi:hypothetical protein
MKYLITFSIMFFSSTAVLAQNLVRNPSFENYSSCPLGPSELENANYWHHPFNNVVGDTCSTSDLYNVCSPFGSFGVGVPASIMGNEPAYTGNGYAGIILYEGFALTGCTPIFGSSWREYVEGELTSPLQAGQTYCVKFYVSLADNVKWATNDIGVYFSNSLINVNCTSVSNSVLPYTPQLEYTGSDLTNSNGWTELSWSYTATGGEQYITIGNFKNDANTSYSCANASAANPYSYYFIDDVSVEMGDCAVACNLDVTIQSSQEDCVQGGTATLTAVPANGSGNYGYDWNGNGTNSTLTNVGDGTYEVTVTDLSTVGCSSTETITIDILDPVIADAGLNDTICKSEGAQLTATGGVSYAWDNGMNGATIDVFPGSTTTFEVTVTGANGCTDTDQATVVVYDIPAVLVEMADQTVCDNSGPISLLASPSGGSFYGPGVSGSTFNPSAAGQGYHTVWYEFGEYEDCLGADSVHFTVDLCTGISSPLSRDNIQIYPNPTNGIFTVESNLNESLPVQIDILDVLGQQVVTPISGNLNQFKHTFDLSHLVAGVYTLRFSSSEKVLNYQLLLE